ACAAARAVTGGRARGDGVSTARFRRPGQVGNGLEAEGEHGLRLPGLFFFKQKTAYEIGLGIPAEPLFRSSISDDIRNILCSSANMRRAIPLILRLLMN